MNIILVDDISRIIWKSYFSIHILPSIILISKHSDTTALPNINIPLSFWFNSNHSLALPLITLPYN